MRTTTSGRGIALVLAGICAGIGVTGTAVAVTATQVSIVDPSAPSHVAHVDSSGRLTTTGPTSTLTIESPLRTGGFENYMTSPTSASLAITSLGFDNPRANAGAAHADYILYLEQVSVGAGSSCVPSGTSTILQRWTVAPGDHVIESPPSPLLIRASGGARYCLAIFGATVDNGTDDGPYFALANLTLYVYSGTYTPAGSSPKSSVKRLHRRAGA